MLHLDYATRLVSDRNRCSDTKFTTINLQQPERVKKDWVRACVRAWCVCVRASVCVCARVYVRVPIFACVCLCACVRVCFCVCLCLKLWIFYTCMYILCLFLCYSCVAPTAFSSIWNLKSYSTSTFAIVVSSASVSSFLIHSSVTGCWISKWEE